MSKIILHCVAEGARLRIKFYAFIDDEGKIFKDAYNHDFNCQFPKAIRSEGAFYEIPDINLTLSNNGRTPFYRVKSAGIKILPEGLDPLGPLAGIATGTASSSKASSNAGTAEPIKVFSVEECVICLTSLELIIMAPCGHQCACAECYQLMPGGAKARKCPLCRRGIGSIIDPRA
jgi:hypothetical protein